MTSPEVPDLIGLANELVLEKIGKPLDKVQKYILQQALEGKKLMEIRVDGFSDGVVQNIFAPRLWKLLLEVTGERVTIRTVRLVLKDAWRSQGDRISPALLPPPKPLLIPFPSSSRVRHNLPAPSCTAFIGRKDEIDRILELLSPTHGARFISIDGIGGVGKTTLAVEAAYRCLSASNNPDEAFLGMPTFDVIIFTSAKQHILAPFGLLNRLNPKRTLRDILRQITSTLRNVDLIGKSFEEQLDCLQEALSLQRTLLIVDNLETVEDPQEVLSFLYDLPLTVTTVLTTRKQKTIFAPLRLSSLPESDGLRLIQHEAKEKEVQLSQEENQALYQKTGGNPAAIQYGVGQLASGRSVSHVLEQLANASGDVARFLFESSVAPLREQDQAAYQLLMALTFFSTPVRREALVEVALANDNDNHDTESINQIARNGLACLQELSLIEQKQDRSTMLPLTHEYVLAELKKHPDFEQAARERWIRWWLRFVDQHGKQEIWDWRSQNDVIEAEWSNIQTVIEWCLLEERHAELYRLWKGLEAHIHLQGSRSKRSICWGDRLDWTKWLIQMATKNGELAVAAEVMVSRGWLLTTMGQPDNLDAADQLFADVWSKLRHHQTPAFELSLAVDIAALRVDQNRLDEAQTWLHQAREIMTQNQIEDTDRLSQLSRLEYYQGRLCFNQGDYELSKAHFTAALTTARAVGWQLVIYRISNWLADIAIQQGELEEAKRLLLDNFQVAVGKQDVYQMAFCQRSLAKLAAAQEDQQTACEQAKQALDNFRNLDMLAEAEATQKLLQALGAEFIE